MVGFPFGEKPLFGTQAFSKEGVWSLPLEFQWAWQKSLIFRRNEFGSIRTFATYWVPTQGLGNFPEPRIFPLRRI